MEFNNVNADERPADKKINNESLIDVCGDHGIIANTNVDPCGTPADMKINDVGVVDVNGNHTIVANNNKDPGGTPVAMDMTGVKVVHINHQEEKSSKLTRETAFIEKRENEEFDWIARLLKPYSTFVVKYPSIIIISSIIIILLSAVLAGVKSVGGKGIPDFSKPYKGYEARTTDVSVRRIVRTNLHNAYKNGLLSHKRVIKRKKRSLSIHDLEDLRLINEDFRVVYEHTNGGNLFDHMVPVCQWYKHKMMTQPNYHLYITHVYHIPNYIALLSGRGDCENITSSDVQQFVSLLEECAGFYKNNSLRDCCSSNATRCTSYLNVISANHMTLILQNTFKYLGDSDLQDNPRVLRLTASVSAVNISDADYFYSIYKDTLADLEDTGYGGIKVVAYNMDGLKFKVFSKEMLSQTALLIVAIVIVILLTWFFSSSLFLGLMTLGCIIAAMLIAFFVYNRIFNMPFFPFLNVLILIFIIGIGADDVFVFTGEWEQAKEIYKLYDSSLSVHYMIKWTTHTLRHTGVSIFVTSFTTAAAFYANISSNVIAVKCFGLFSGTAIVVKYLLMITLFPCCVVIHEKYFSKCMHFCCPSVCKILPVVHALDQTNNDNEETNIRSNFTQRCKDQISTISDSFFDKYLPWIIYHMRYIFIVVFFSLGVAGVVVAFGEPGLNPPLTRALQLFSLDTSIEQYDFFIKEKFDAGISGGDIIHIDFIFGAKLVDNGNKFDPDDTGSLVLKEGELEISSDQIWLNEFCTNVKAADFYVSSDSCDLIEDFFNKLTGPCGNRKDCCNKQLPLSNKDEFKTCFFKLVQGDVKRGIYQPLYSNGVLKTLVIKVTTNYQTSAYSGNERIVEKVDSWTSLQLSNVSSSFNGWWAVGRELMVYDLQNALYMGTNISLGIAIAVAFLVILFTSLNIILSIFSVITILFIVSLTVGILIGDDWKMNIVESTVFSVAAGLSADFTMHYSIAYKESLFKGDRKRRVKDTLSHIGSAMFLGAVTTFIGGLVMYPATVLAYAQIGTFLMVVMFMSWLYSNFFFLPLCCVFGPLNNFGQIRCCRKKHQ